MLKLKKNNDLIFPKETIELILDEEILDKEYIIKFKCDDGVDFKINYKYTKPYSYTIPRGMAGQTYHITFNNDNYQSNEVILKVEKDIRDEIFRYNDKVLKVKMYDDVYDAKSYVSLKDIKDLLSGTDKDFAYERISLNKIFINGKERRYFTYLNLDEPFIYITDLMLLLDSGIEKINNEYIIKDELIIDIKKLDKELYFKYLHGCIVGDADSGEIYYSSNENNVCAIASTSKLLTLLLVREEIEKGKLSFDSFVNIPEVSEREALSEDGVVYLKEGMKLPLKEALDCLMLPSSNECAIALACMVSGSEEEFVKKMNEKCKELGLKDSFFYNASGLPYYSKFDFPGKLQNRMTASDMFKLASYIVRTYPDLTTITSKKTSYIKTLDVTLTNTNPVLFNMDECIGLKTGTTNRAGCCLVTLCKYKNRRIISVVFGAESGQERNEKSEILQRMVRNLLK